MSATSSTASPYPAPAAPMVTCAVIATGPVSIRCLRATSASALPKHAA